jgi:hypothetical protein
MLRIINRWRGQAISCQPQGCNDISPIAQVVVSVPSGICRVLTAGRAGRMGESVGLVVVDIAPLSVESLPILSLPLDPQLPLPALLHSCLPLSCIFSVALRSLVSVTISVCRFYLSQEADVCVCDPQIPTVNLANVLGDLESCKVLHVHVYCTTPSFPSFISSPSPPPFDCLAKPCER